MKNAFSDVEKAPKKLQSEPGKYLLVDEATIWLFFNLINYRLLYLVPIYNVY